MDKLNLIMDSEISIYVAFIILWNFIVFLLYGIDKVKSRGKGRRISERTLLVVAFLFGGLGAFLGMHLFHHKTKHHKFILLIPISIFVNILVVLFLLFQ